MYLKARTHSTRVQKLSCKIKNQNLACPPLTARHKEVCKPPLSSLGNQDPAEDGLAVAVELLKKVKKERISGSFLFIFSSALKPSNTQACIKQGQSGPPWS